MRSPHKIAPTIQRFDTLVLVNSRTYILVNMTSFANKMQIFLWQVATVIPIKSTRASVHMLGVQTKSLTITTCHKQYSPKVRFLIFKISVLLKQKTLHRLMLLYNVLLLFYILIFCFCMGFLYFM